MLFQQIFGLVEKAVFDPFGPRVRVGRFDGGGLDLVGDPWPFLRLGRAAKLG